MSKPYESVDLPARILAAWPAEAWRNVHALIAVSGGPDSMALLRGLLAAKERIGGAGQLIAAHVDHQLRGAESAADAAWLAEECNRLGIPFIQRRCDAASLASERGHGVEEAARAARYRLLTGAAEERGARFVAFGHTQNDQVETVLFRLLRGSGLRGLAGIPATRPLSASVAAIRPLLSCTRDDVTAYLASLGQAIREDLTNRNLEAAARNRIRAELLPYVRRYFNCEVDSALIRTATLAGEAQAAIESLAAALLERCLTSVATPPARDVRAFTLATTPLEREQELVACEAVRLAWREAAWPEQGMTRQWWRRLTQFAQSPESAPSLNLPGGIRAERPATDLLLLSREGLP